MFALRKNVSISGLTITGADARQSEPAIRSLENLTLDAVHLVDNAANTAIVLAHWGNLTIRDSVFAGNRGASVIESTGDRATVTDTRLTDNVVTSSQGSVLSLGADVVDLVRVEVSMNGHVSQSPRAAAAVDVRADTVTVADSVIRDNQGMQGLVCGADMVEIRNSVVSGNSLSGISISSAFGKISIADTEVSENGDTGIYLQLLFSQSAEAIIRGCEIRDNHGRLANAGGVHAILSDGSIAILDSLISGNTGQSTFSQAAAGGVFLQMQAGAAMIERCSIVGNISQPQSEFPSYAGGIVRGAAAR